MEPLTHFLTGACLGRAGLNRKTALATLTLTLAAEAPDLDVLGSWKGSLFGFEHHRGFTHSFLGLVIVAAAVVGFVYLIWLLRGRKVKNSALPPRWGLLFGYAYLAGLTHILLDFTNNYGVRPFWPFSEKWYSWDIVFIVDPFLLGFLIAALILPLLFGLIDQEIGSRQKGPRGRIAATLALAGMVGLWGVRDYEHRRAVNALEARSYEDAEPVRASAFPQWWNPFRWDGVVELPDAYAMATVNSLIPDVDPDGHLRIYHKPEETPVTKAARDSELGRVYLAWAQYPLLETQVVDAPRPGYIVYFRDLRYGPPQANGRTTLGASAELDENLKVIAEGFGSRRKPVSPGLGGAP